MLGPMLTLFLSRSDVSRHTQALHLLQELRDTLGAVGAWTSTEHRFAPVGDRESVVRSGGVPGIPAYAVSVRADPPSSAGPRAVLQLHDGATGKLLAIMDSGHLQALRSALLGALAADVLARPDARRVAILGSGAAASGALKALRLVRSIEQVQLFDPELARSFELALTLKGSLAMAVESADSAAAAVAQADLVVLTGGVTLPVDAVQAGTHVTVLGAEAFLECPLPRETVARARRFRDAPSSSLTWGAPFDARLGEVLRGEAKGRGAPEDVTLFVSVDPPALDLVAAWHVYQGARHDDQLPLLDLEA
jgi:ornithine cyclodeaminase